MNNINDHILKLRQDYSLHQLDESSVSRDPYTQFSAWMKEAIDANVNEPNAMILSTVSPSGMPSGRVLLLRNVSENGFSFFTSYHSRKANDIVYNSNAAMTFFWPELQRQVRIEGTLTKLSEKESQDYFRTRPRENQLSSWAGQQSTPVTKEILGKKLEEVKQRFANEEVPCPPFWGGYCLQPRSIEFWQGRPARFHDRIIYTLSGDGSWNITRLVP